MESNVEVVAVEIKNSALLKPWPPAGPPVLGAMLPLTFFDLLSGHHHFTFVLAFRAPTPSDDEMRTALSAALAHFPVLAGRLAENDAGRPCVALNDEGARLCEARAPVALADVGDDELATLLPAHHDACAPELLLLQLTRFACGGLAVGVSVNHRVADGRSIAMFLSAWADICRGCHDGGPSPSACLGRAALIAPGDPPSERRFDHLVSGYIPRPPPPAAADSRVQNVRLHFSMEFIAELKASVPGRAFTRFECLFAHLWKKMTIARAVDDEETSEAIVAMDGRKRLSPPVAFFGNMVVGARPKLLAGELKHGDLTTTVRAVHEAIAEIDDGFIRSLIDFGKEMEGKEDEHARNTLCHGRPGNHDVVVTSWLGFGLDDLDLGAGGGTSSAFMYSAFPFDGGIGLFPSHRAKGGVVSQVSLSSDAAAEMLKICYDV